MMQFHSLQHTMPIVFSTSLHILPRLWISLNFLIMFVWKTIPKKSIIWLQVLTMSPQALFALILGEGRSYLHNLIKRY